MGLGHVTRLQYNRPGFGRYRAKKVFQGKGNYGYQEEAQMQLGGFFRKDKLGVGRSIKRRLHRRAHKRAAAKRRGK